MDPRELKLRALAVQSEHAFIIVDVAGTILDWEGAATKIFGYAREEIVGKRLEVLFTPEDLARGEFMNELASAASYGKGEDDRWMLRKDGCRFWASGALTPIVNDRGEAVAFVKILRDRTDIRAQLDTLRNRLETFERNGSHTRVFLATLAHELRNPLFAISASARVLERIMAKPPAATESVATIERQLAFISKLVGNLADVSRAAEGQLKLNVQDVDLCNVIRYALESCMPALAQKRQYAEVLASSPITLEGDPTRLQQVLVNLVANASKFSPSNAKIWIKATIEGPEVVVRVQDKGIGVPSQFLPRMFELFTQAELPERYGAEHGMGLGLPLVKSIVELHHGTVQATSPGENQGTEVTVHLPIRQPAN